jgi:hypothetical protein
MQVLLSPEHGFFFWTPLAALSIAGLIVMAVGRVRLKPDTTAGAAAPEPDVNGHRSAVSSGIPDSDCRRIGLCMLLMFGLQVYISGAVESWTVAGAFGQRRFVATTILLVIGLAALQSAIRLRAARLALNGVIAICVWWNIALMAEFGTSMMNRQRLEMRRNAYDAFVTLPRTAPGLVYRYFVARRSFYATDPR